MGDKRTRAIDYVIFCNLDDESGKRTVPALLILLLMIIPRWPSRHLSDRISTLSTRHSCCMRYLAVARLVGVPSSHDDFSGFFSLSLCFFSGLDYSRDEVDLARGDFAAAAVAAATSAAIIVIMVIFAVCRLPFCEYSGRPGTRFLFFCLYTFTTRGGQLSERESARSHLENCLLSNSFINLSFYCGQRKYFQINRNSVFD